MSVIHAPREGEFISRFLFVPVVGGVLFGALLLRLWYLQVVQADELRERADSAGLVQVDRLAPRGRIVDRKGVLLAGNRQTILITAKPSEIAKHPEVVPLLARALGVPAQKLRDKIKEGAWRPDLPTPVHVGASIDVASKIVEQQHRFRGVGVESLPMRFYPDTRAFSHVLGYVWTPSRADLDRLKHRGIERPPAYVGKIGLEQVYDPDLMGTPGVERLQVDARRRTIRPLGVDRATPGRKLELTLDADLQRHAYAALGGRKGAVVALDPTSGGVLALVSSPSYDASLFLHGISVADYQALQKDPDLPQLNRAIYGSYAPGSTFKILTSIAAASEGKLSFSERIHCPGYYQVGTRKVRCLGRHGSIPYDTALIRSCNTYFSALAQRTGADAMRAACDLVGLGRKTGIDLVGESAGVVPTMAWIRKWRNPPVWYPGDTVNFGIGQGEVSVTPLQMACLAALVANRGESFRPHLVRRVWDVNGTERRSQPEPLGKVPLPEAFWDRLHEALAGVIEQGTGARARIAGLEWCGKTGSAEHRRASKTHSWFVAFAPRRNPKIALAVVVEHGGHGGELAAPIAAEIVRHYLRPRQAAVYIDAAPSSSAAASARPASVDKPSSR